MFGEGFISSRLYYLCFYKRAKSFYSGIKAHRGSGNAIWYFDLWFCVSLRILGRDRPRYYGSDKVEAAAEGAVLERHLIMQRTT